MILVMKNMMMHSCFLRFSNIITECVYLCGMSCSCNELLADSTNTKNHFLYSLLVEIK